MMATCRRRLVPPANRLNSRFGQIMVTEGERRMKKQTLTDADIRPALRLRLLDQHLKDPDTVLIEELGLCRGQVRVDLAVVNGALHGFEIKSDRDSLRRLSKQIEFYGLVLDLATLVVGKRHLDQAVQIVPNWWGLLQVEVGPNGPLFESIRHCRNNPSREPRSIVELVWLDEALALLETRHAARGVRGKPRHVVWDRLCERFSVDEIAAIVRSELKARVARRDR